ncbi:MAG: hypothetical protein EOR81_12295 [Mesorhizobium sp.]|nr:MAG: hypothetical protein EOR81_12295 [Mesorhizobium sp.]
MADPTLTVTRSDNGTATFSYVNGSVTKTFSGYWDDATPWKSGTYNAAFKNHKGDGIAAFQVLTPEGRGGINLHPGQDTRWSNGCLVTDASNITFIYNNLGVDFVTQVKDVGFTKSALKIVVENDWDAYLKLESSTPWIEEGSDGKLTVSLGGNGGSNGLSKGVWVQISRDGGTASDGTDVIPLSGTTLSGHGKGWFYIPKGATSVDIPVKTVSDTKDDEGSETSAYKISAYLVENKFNTSTSYYQDKAKTLTAKSTDTTETITILDKPSILDKTVNASGGFEGYANTEQFSPGQTLSLFFDPYSIPDQMRIASSNGSVLVDTGFIGGTSYSTTFQVPQSSDGRVNMSVLTNNPGTAWEFSLSTVPIGPTATASIGSWTALLGELPHEEAVAISATAVVHVTQNETMQDEGNQPSVGLSFDVVADDVAAKGKTILWRVHTGEAGSVSDADFPAGTALQGTFTIPDDAEIGDVVYSHDFSDPLQDGISEGSELLRVGFFDADTLKPLSDSGGNPVVIEYTIGDGTTVVSPIVGTDGDDELTGVDDGDNISSGLGADKVKSLGGPDAIDLGAGDDDADGGGGDDTFYPGFGNDIIDGGSDVDRVIIPRLSSEVDIREQPDGSVLLIDNSAVPLGEKLLRNVEKVEFTDVSVDIDSGGSPGPDCPVVDRPGTQDGSAATDDVLTGPAFHNTFFVAEEGTSGHDRITNFAKDDVFATSKALFDSNGDGIITFGTNKLLDLDGPDAGIDTVSFDGLDAKKGLRFLGEGCDDVFVYATATVRPKGALEGRLGDDALAGDNPDAKANTFFFDTALDLNLGHDKITNFGGKDILVTTTQLFDSNNDGKIAFGPNHLLDLSGGLGGPGDPGSPGEVGDIAIKNTGGAAVTSLEFDGLVAHSGVNYYVYSGIGSAAGMDDLLFA